MRSLGITSGSPHPGKIATCTLVAPSIENDNRNINANKPGDGSPLALPSM
ncbi:hypothetical protein OKW21_004510 [Catalinimonas alkaloidigena]|nr:hypothetical protein [Catalinimonas alkaloidigena]